MFGARAGAALVLATLFCGGAGAYLPNARSDVHNWAVSERATATASVHSVSSLPNLKSLIPQSLDLKSFNFSQTSSADECDASRFQTLVDAAIDCTVCLNDGTCDDTTCVVGSIPGMSSSQFFVCPVLLECCVRVILDSNDDVNAIVTEGVYYEDGAVTDDGGDKCPGDCALTSSLDCEGGGVRSPPYDATPGTEAECADSTASSATTEATDRDPAATRAPPIAEPAAPAPASTRPPAETARVSSTATTPPEPTTKACFPSDASVELERGEVVRMDALAVGDSVKVGANKFSKVFMFTHKMADVSVDFVTLETASGASLSLTSGHYIYANDALVAAGSVAIGDQLVLGDGARSSVTSVSHATKRGLYNPQTVSGDIIVNGVAASTYTTAVDPVFAHFLLAPLRAASRLGFSYNGLESGGGYLATCAPGGEATIA